MNAAARMLALTFIAMLAMTGCTTTPEYPQPAADKAQIVVKVTATPKTGAQGPRTEGQYDKESVEKGRRFTRVNYSKMDCIAVVVRPRPQGGSRVYAKLNVESPVIQIGAESFDRDLSIAFLASMQTGSGTRMAATIGFENLRDKAMTLYGAAQGDGDALFEMTIGANKSASCMVHKEGIYDVYCDEDERLFCQFIVSNSPYMELCESGGELFFDALTPGEYEVEVYAPRLPVWKAKINTTGGKRETLYAEVTVNKLPKK